MRCARVPPGRKPPSCRGCREPRRRVRKRSRRLECRRQVGPRDTTNCPHIRAQRFDLPTEVQLAPRFSLPPAFTAQVRFPDAIQLSMDRIKRASPMNSAVGGYGRMGTTLGDYIVAFALPD